MSSQSLEIAKTRYHKGKIAFENGHYREAVEELEKASALLAPNSRLGGEVKIWLVTAYEAGGRTEDAIALCEELKRHPHWETSKQAKRLVYILKAPKLKRPQEWMTQIPDLGTISDNESKAYFNVKPQKSADKKKSPSVELIDPSQVETKDNSFIWVGLIVMSLILGSLVWFGFSTP